VRVNLNRFAINFAFVPILILSIAALGCTTGGFTRSPASQDIQDDAGENESLRRLKKESQVAGNSLFGGGRNQDDGTGAKIGINALLWRASLDTVSFMPLASADPFGGVILTDWFSNPDTPKERFKITIYILDKRLRADAVRVSFFRQVKKGNRWTDASVAKDSARRIEDQILTKARQLRIAQAEG